MISLIIGGILLAFVSGAGLYMYASGKTAGRAACVAELKAADDQLAEAATKVEQQAATRTAELAKAHADGEAKAKTRVVYVQQKGAADVAKYPVFRDANCVLPAESLRNLNAARAGLRSEPPADGVRGAADGAPIVAGPAADPRAPTSGVREPIPAAQGNNSGNVPADVGGRRPLGKVRPQG